MAEKLFAEFPPVSTEQWEEVIIKDLKGADYEKKLVWKTQEGFSVRPYYRAENLEGVKHLGGEAGAFPFVIAIKSSVPRPFINSTIAGLIPKINGTKTEAPNIANIC